MAFAKTVALEELFAWTGASNGDFPQWNGSGWDNISDVARTGITNTFTQDQAFDGNISVGGGGIDANEFISIKPSAFSFSNNVEGIATTLFVTNAVSNRGVKGFESFVVSQATGGTTLRLYGNDVGAFNFGSGGSAATITALVGMNNQVQNGPGDATTGASIRNFFDNYSSGTVTDGFSVWNELKNSGSGTITSAAILYAKLLNTDAGGTIGTGYGLKLADWSNAGTVTTSYGIYMDSSIDVGNTRYAIYSSALSDSYLAGNVGIGTTGPQKALHVVGTILVDGDQGGIADTVGLTDVTDLTANSSGVGTIKFKGTTSRDSSGFLKIYIGTTAYYIPVFSAISG